MSDKTDTKNRKLVYGIPKSRRQVPALTCSGCGHALIGKMALEVIEELGIEEKTIAVSGIGCTGMLYLIPGSTVIDFAIASHGTPPAIALGIKRAHFGEVMVYTLQGDGDAAAIGLGCLISSAARGDPITVIMFNNAVYATTGGQLAPTTMTGQITTTTPAGRSSREGYPLHTAELLSPIKGVAYSARGSVHSPAHYQRTKKYMKTAFQAQMAGSGFSFIEVLSICPTNWHMSPNQSLEWVESTMVKEFPLGEFKNTLSSEQHDMELK